MGGIYYNEWDEPAARWLRELGAGHNLPSGHIDTRSIRDVQPDDVVGYDQCHFFAGIGGWPLALRWAGLENVPGIWTGSPPCQPFSVAGKGLAQSDERHLAPVWLDLIRECRPSMLFGEQVADAIGKGWLDDLFDALEREGYACGAAVLPACGVGAPHIRKRLFFGAVRMDDTSGSRHIRQIAEPESKARHETRVCLLSDGCTESWLADADEGQCRGLANSEGGKFNRSQARWIQGDGVSQSSSVFRRMADANGGGPGDREEQRCGEHRLFAQGGGNVREGREGARPESDGLADPMLSGRPEGRAEPRGGSTSGRSSDSGVANTNDTRPQGRTGMPKRADEQPLGPGSLESGSADPHHGGWARADWLGCRDGKFRPVEPGTQPLAHGLPARVGRLRGYGNAIVPQVAATFITEFLGAFADVMKNH